MSMNSDGARVPGELRAQRPVAMRPVVDRHPRERVPLAEEDPIADVPFRVDDVEGRGARELGCSRGADEDDRESWQTGAAVARVQTRSPRRSRAPRPS